MGILRRRRPARSDAFWHASGHPDLASVVRDHSLPYDDQAPETSALARSDERPGLRAVGDETR